MKQHHLFLFAFFLIAACDLTQEISKEEAFNLDITLNGGRFNYEYFSINILEDSRDENLYSIRRDSTRTQILYTNIQDVPTGFNLIFNSQKKGSFNLTKSSISISMSPVGEVYVGSLILADSGKIDITDYASDASFVKGHFSAVLIGGLFQNSSDTVLLEGSFSAKDLN